MKPIFLIGYMCSGKTTLGEALAREAAVDFIDLDAVVEARAGMPVTEIFARLGEDTFRRLESEALSDMCRREDTVIGCGGGTPCVAGAMEAMNEAGTTVWLVPDESRLLSRLLEGRAKRPLIAALPDDEVLPFARRGLEARRGHYAKARVIFDSSLLENEEEIAQTVGRFITQFNLPRR